MHGLNILGKVNFYRSKILKYDIINIENCYYKNLSSENNSQFIKLKNTLFKNVKKIYNETNDISNDNILKISLNPPTATFINITYTNDIKIIVPRGVKITYEYE